ncbi:ecdysteroid 22-kinase family protein [Marinobacter hydrocarbonoclasticus]|nr:ecdysteroid 22-kinase family protein [Marinobacter nauticus]
MNEQTATVLERVLGQPARKLAQRVQSLWSGYGAIERWVMLDGQRVIVKRIAPPVEAQHPRGWHTDTGHQRKLKSYRIEQYWYQHFRSAEMAWPHCLGAEQLDGTTYLILTDLDQQGFAQRPEAADDHHIALCLGWLAEFHARFLGHDSNGLWRQGGYWHLETRQEEWQRMTHLRLKAAATDLDRALATARWQTLVHGDAKLANFCFGNDKVAAVDFQYVGGGPGVVDLAYFLGSVFEGPQLATRAQHWLDHYFSELMPKLTLTQSEALSLEAEWRRLYPVAVADFARFLDGWAPDHWKVNAYSLEMVERVLGEPKFFLAD